MKKKLESLKDEKFSLSKDEMSSTLGGELDYSIKYYTTKDVGHCDTYDEEVYDICWYSASPSGG
ncbi:MAG: hypothetical protein WD512_05000 [Candidatus Paceibacterota bacterium]